MTEVQWTKKAIRQLRTIDTRYQKAISEKINRLTTFPMVELDIKKLKSTNNQYRLRVGDYRVIFEIIDSKPVICTIKEIKRRTSQTY
ncbi:type II toxin-antitoxin system RelE/ParE family toxin [Morganella morganii]|uniref:type II toxin-antitoxin system RelE family toxin n=1 Tax=Morganella morganii TaxID=582 RepID=UPI0034E51DD3